MLMISDVINAYMAAWNEPDESERDALLRRCWAVQGSTPILGFISSARRLCRRASR